jgi:hypothetical protein
MPYISIQFGHLHFLGAIPKYGNLQGDIQPGMHINYSILSVMIHLLKQELPSMIGASS